MIYPAGNFIECGGDAPFPPIASTNTASRILDRAVTFDTHLYDVLKIALISMDSTIRSNLAVGLPIDILVLRRDALKPELVHRIEAGERYFHDLRERWSAALKAAHMAIPAPALPAGAATPALNASVQVELRRRDPDLGGLISFW